jgi:hypothetical protein
MKDSESLRRKCMDFMNDKTETTLGDSLSSAQCLWTGKNVRKAKEFGVKFIDRLTEFGAHIHGVRFNRDEVLDIEIEDDYDIYLTYNTLDGFSTSEATLWMRKGPSICSFAGKELIATDAQVIMAEMGFCKMLTSEIVRNEQRGLSDLMKVYLDTIMRRAIYKGSSIALYNILNTDWGKILDNYCELNKMIYFSNRNRIGFGNKMTTLIKLATKLDEPECVAILLRYNKDNSQNNGEEDMKL